MLSSQSKYLGLYDDIGVLKIVNTFTKVKEYNTYTIIMCFFAIHQSPWLDTVYYLGANCPTRMYCIVTR